MRPHHILDRIGDDLARRQRVEHAFVAHRYTVVDGDRVELCRKASGTDDLVGYQPPDIAQMHMARHKLSV